MPLKSPFLYRLKMGALQSYDAAYISKAPLTKMATLTASANEPSDMQLFMSQKCLRN